MIAHPSIGTLDGYRLERLLAHGGMGDVYEAVDEETETPVAIKLLRVGNATDKKTLARFAEEIRTSTRLSHPHIVRVLGAGFGEAGPYLAMELLRGRTLDAELSERKRLGPAETLALLLPVLGAVAVAHRAGVLHRDLKPANLFLHEEADGARVPKLLDFGIAKVVEAHALTYSGTVIGTPQYMSPEQAADESLGTASDVWSMGVIFYRCLSGRVPFAASTPAALMHKLVHDRAPSILSIDRTLPPRVAAAVDKALERSPDARYASMEDFAQALVWTAVADGVELPDDPDPIGLSEWRAWLEEATSDDATAQSLIPAARKRTSPPPAEPAALVATGLDPVSATPEPQPQVVARRRASPLTLWIAGLVGAGAAVAGVAGMLSQGEAERETPARSATRALPPPSESRKTSSDPANEAERERAQTLEPAAPSAPPVASLAAPTERKAPSVRDSLPPVPRASSKAVRPRASSSSPALSESAAETGAATTATGMPVPALPAPRTEW